MEFPALPLLLGSKGIALSAPWEPAKGKTGWWLWDVVSECSFGITKLLDPVGVCFAIGAGRRQSSLRCSQGFVGSARGSTRWRWLR